MHRLSLFALALAVALAACVSSDPRLGQPLGTVLVESDADVPTTADRLQSALDAAEPVSVVARLSLGGGVATRVAPELFVFGNPALGTPIMQQNQLAGLDLPRKMLVYAEGDRARVLYTSPAHLAARYGVTIPDGLAMALPSFAAAAAGADAAPTVGALRVGLEEGVVVLTSRQSFEATVAEIRELVADNDDATLVAEVDHRANAASVDLDLRPTTLFLIQGPAGQTTAPLVAFSPQLGLALPLRLLVYEDADGVTQMAYNGRDYIAERYDVSGDGSSAAQVAVGFAEGFVNGLALLAADD